MEKSEIRVFLRYYRKQGFNATAAAKKISEVEGYNVVSDRTARLVQAIQRRRHGPRGQDVLKSNFEGVIHFDFVPNGRTSDAELYYAPLDRMYAAIGKKYPALIKRTRAPLQQDNAKPRTAKQTKEKIKTLDAIELLPDPANSLHIVSHDYHLFRSMAHFLRGRSLNDLDDVENGCREFFASKNKEWYRSGIEQLADRWVQAIDSNGLYFET
ncbi:unnamed protein product [Bursaphelenchus xylophilus]|uniref:(pine wood nematode) hypothetical protein n=1 Tax=Bursaphelenchus xylophilus TaxID=6326 RepID=A0A1I7SPF4_BURXY|nr:unnamed protein product [Bursaphelenchus xylophilus]CAG9120653.1 unnamed protein product [Bursaphelenchus xylophilus]